MYSLHVTVNYPSHEDEWDADPMAISLDELKGHIQGIIVAAEYATSFVFVVVRRKD